MRVKVMPEKLIGNPDGIPIVPSKSMAQRILLASALAGEMADVPVSSEDVADMKRVLAAISASSAGGHTASNTGNSTASDTGNSIASNAGGYTASNTSNAGGHTASNNTSDTSRSIMPRLEIRESGATLRFILPVLAAQGRACSIHLGEGLAKRPLSPLWEELVAHGAELSRPDPTTIIIGDSPMNGGCFKIAGNVSSQFISGLMFALSLIPEEECDEETIEDDRELNWILVKAPVESKGYIDMTREVLEYYGFKLNVNEEQDGDLLITFYETPETSKATEGQASADASTNRRSAERSQRQHLSAERSQSQHLAVEGDWSSAAFFLAALSTPPAAPLLRADSFQPDRAVVELLEEMKTAESLEVSGTPDIVPILAVKAATLDKDTCFEGIRRLRFKESDRVETTVELIRALGGKAEAEENRLIVHGGGLRGGCTYDPAGDHRMAMAAAVGATFCQEPVIIENAQVVAKSYPEFWDHFEKMGGKLERLDV